MRNRAVGKKVSLVAAMGVVCVLAFGAASWKDLAARFYLDRLRRDSSDLVDFWTRPEGTPQGRAVRSFLKEPDGAASVVRLLLKAVVSRRGNGLVMDANFFPTSPGKRDVLSVDYHLRGRVKTPPGKTNTLQEVDSALIGWAGGRSPDQSKSFAMDLQWPWAHVQMRTSRGAPVPISASLVREVLQRKVELPEYPGLKFWVLPSAEAKAIYAKLSPWQSLRADELPSFTGKYACLVSRVESLPEAESLTEAGAPWVLVPEWPRWLRELFHG